MEISVFVNVDVTNTSVVRCILIVIKNMYDQLCCHGDCQPLTMSNFHQVVKAFDFPKFKSHLLLHSTFSTPPPLGKLAFG